MHSQFGEWYQAVSLPQPSETLKLRWTAVESLEIHKETAAELAQFAFGDLSNKEYELEFRAHMQETDAGFRMKGNDAEVSLLAAAALIQLLEDSWDHEAVVAALAVKTANLAGLRQQKCIVPELVTAANSFLEDLAKGRAKWKSLEKEVDPTKALPLLKSALAVSNEDTQILWWLFGETTIGSQKGFSTFAAKELAFIVGKEASDLTIIFPAPVSIWGILHRALTAAKDAPKITKVDIRDAILAAPQEFTAGLIVPKSIRTALPLISSIEMHKTGGSDWDAGAQKLIGIKKGASLKPVDLALQAFWERQFVKAIS